MPHFAFLLWLLIIFLHGNPSMMEGTRRKLNIIIKAVKILYDFFWILTIETDTNLFDYLINGLVTIA